MRKQAIFPSRKPFANTHNLQQNINLLKLKIFTMQFLLYDVTVVISLYTLVFNMISTFPTLCLKLFIKPIFVAKMHNTAHSPQLFFFFFKFMYSLVELFSLKSPVELCVSWFYYYYHFATIVHHIRY